MCRYLRKFLKTTDKMIRRELIKGLLAKHLRHWFLVLGPKLPEPVMDYEDAKDLANAAKLDQVMYSRPAASLARLPAPPIPPPETI